MTTTPTFIQLNERLGGDLVERFRQAYSARTRADRAFFKLTLPAFVVLYLLAIYMALTAVDQKPLGASLPLLVGLASFYAAAVVANYVYIRRLRQQSRFDVVVSALVNVIWNLEGRPQAWRLSVFRLGVTRDLERIARVFEGLPVGLDPGDAATARSLANWGAGVAAYFRELKLWALWPQDFTYTDLLDELSRALEMCLSGRWRDLPERSVTLPAQRSIHWGQLLWGVVGVLLVAGAIIGFIVPRNTSAGAAVLLPLVGSAGLVALTKAGLSLQAVTDARKTFDVLRSTEKNAARE